MRAACLSLAFLLLSTSGLAAEDFTVVRHITGGGTTQEMVIRIKDGKTRIDAGSANTILINPQTGVMSNIVHSMRAYSQVSFDFLRQYGQRQQAEATTPPSPPRKTGRTQKISGYPCAEYVATIQQPGIGPVRMQLWVTDTIEAGTAFMKAMERLAEAGIAGGDQHLVAGAVPGFPIRVVTVLPNNQSVVATVRSLSTASIDPEIFEIPPNYRKMEHPGIPDAP